MESSVAEKIREIELYTRRLMRQNLIGDKTSAIKGSGLEFDQIREYQIGDDVRFIDWNSSARMNRLLVKQFYEERNRVIIIALDISESCFFGTIKQKYDVMSHIAGIVALVGEYAKDQIGLLLFSDEINEYIPPRKGRTHVRSLLEKIFTLKPKQKKTNITVALNHLVQLKKRNAIVFLISDFIDTGFESKLSSVACLYDLIAVRITHSYEYEFPNVGLICTQDIETGQEIILNTKKGSALRVFMQERLANQKEMLQRNNIDLIDLNPESMVLPVLVDFFNRRKK